MSTTVTASHISADAYGPELRRSRRWSRHRSIALAVNDRCTNYRCLADGSTGRIAPAALRLQRRVRLSPDAAQESVDGPPRGGFETVSTRSDRISSPQDAHDRGLTICSDCTAKSGARAPRRYAGRFAAHGTPGEGRPRIEDGRTDWRLDCRLATEPSLDWSLLANFSWFRDLLFRLIIAGRAAPLQRSAQH